MALTCNNLTASYNVPLFRGLGFSVGPGSLMVLKGSNGSGKTTLLKMLAGLITPAEGEITFNGENIALLGNSYRQEFAYLGHQLAIKPQFTVRQNIAYWAALRDTKDLLLAAIVYFKLEPLLDTPCYALSAGWKKRVALARLMVSQADIWLLDEPEANLDKDAQLLLRNLLLIRAEQGGTVILASHYASDFEGAALLELGDFQH
jgi:heme exporter protein A